MEQKDFSDPTLSQIISALKKVQGQLKDPKTAAPERKPEAKDIVSRVSQWLESESGYPLEMVTVAALASAGFGVVQSDYFEDQDGEREILRELDVTGYVNHSESGISISVAILVECKSSVG